MMQLDEGAGLSCARLLDALPIPVAIVDRHGRYVYLNGASAGDPVLGAVQAGHNGLETKAEGPVRRLARQRRARYEEAIRTQQPVYFEETMDDHGRMRWLCAPIRDAGRRGTDVIVLGFDVTSVHRQAMAASRHVLVDRITREVQIPLMALVGLTHSLAHELSGTQGERAEQIDQGGELLLRQLRALLASAPATNGM